MNSNLNNDLLKSVVSNMSKSNLDSTTSQDRLINKVTEKSFKTIVTASGAAFDGMMDSLLEKNRKVFCKRMEDIIKELTGISNSFHYYQSETPGYRKIEVIFITDDLLKYELTIESNGEQLEKDGNFILNDLRAKHSMFFV